MRKLGVIAFISALALGVILASFFSFGRFSLPIFSLGHKVTGSGHIRTVDRAVSDFDRIEVSGVFRVEVTLQRDYAVQIAADDNLLPLIKTDVEDRTLKIKSVRRIFSRQPMTVRVFAPDIEAVASSGASQIEITNIKNDFFQIDSSGASRIKAEGLTRNLTIDSSGASKISADYLKAENAGIDSSGASKISVFVTDTLTADLSGASNVVYTGNPKNLKKKTSGVSCVREKRND